MMKPACASAAGRPAQSPTWQSRSTTPRCSQPSILRANDLLAGRPGWSQLRPPVWPPIWKALAGSTEVVAVGARQRRKAAAVRTEVKTIRAPERRHHLERRRRRRIDIERVVGHAVTVWAAMEVEAAKVAHQRHGRRCRLLRRGRDREGLDVECQERPQHGASRYHG